MFEPVKQFDAQDYIRENSLHALCRGLAPPTNGRYPSWSAPFQDIHASLPPTVTELRLADCARATTVKNPSLAKRTGSSAMSIAEMNRAVAMCNYQGDLEPDEDLLDVMTLRIELLLR